MSDKYELIVTIANEGFSDIIMDAAREAGARGGTITSARGSGNAEIEKRYGIVITPQKEMIYILIDADIKDNVMSAINKAAGMETKGQAITFSMPVSNVSGLKF